MDKTDMKCMWNKLMALVCSLLLSQPHHTCRPADNVKGAITLSFFLGGGAIAADELQFADTYGAPWVYIPCA